MSVAERVLTVLAEIADLEEVRTNKDILLFETHALDSMKTVELMVALSDELGVEISPAEFDRRQWATPGKIVEYIEARMAE
jgi:D-alanine--poly(phosphoribitol) ligase subunit 2